MKNLGNYTSLRMKKKKSYKTNKYSKIMSVLRKKSFCTF